MGGGCRKPLPNDPAWSAPTKPSPFGKAVDGEAIPASFLSGDVRGDTETGDGGITPHSLIATAAAAFRAIASR